MVYNLFMALVWFLCLLCVHYFVCLFTFVWTELNWFDFWLIINWLSSDSRVIHIAGQHSVSHCRSITEKTGSNGDVRHYSQDQFESFADHTTTNDHHSSGRLRTSSHKSDQTTNVQQDKDRRHSTDDEPVLSHKHSGR